MICCCNFSIFRSNCVINLSPNKEAVLKEAYRVLKVCSYLVEGGGCFALGMRIEDIPPPCVNI